MKSMSSLGVWAGAAAFVLVSAACDNTARGVKQDAEENKKEAAELSAEARDKAEIGAQKTENAAERAADATANAAERAANATANAAERAADATADAGRAAVGTAGAAVQTVDVKAALIADKRVDAGGIDVDTDYATKTISLKGHVPNAAQKRIAEEIAVSKASGYHVKNELVVR